MNSSLLQSNQYEQLEENSLFSNLFINQNNNNSLFEIDNNDNNDTFSFLKNESFNEDNSSYKEKSFNFLNKKNMDNLPGFLSKNFEQNKIFDSLEQFNTINNMKDNTSCINFSPLLTTSNSNMNSNIGVKKDELNFESQKDILNANINTQSENLNDEVFKCDFLEKIALGLDDSDDNFYYNNKKNIVNLNDTTSIFAAIINLMKEKGPIEIKKIVSCLEGKKDTFRKKNGSRYKQEFSKLVRTTLNTPEIFYKTEEGNKYFFIEDKNAYYLQKKRERGMNKILFKLKKKNTLLPINVKIQLDKVNLIIKKMEKKYKGDKKYVNVMICINMFKSLIDKYLLLIKMSKVNSIYELTVLNEKIIDICHTLEKIEKGEFFPQTIENIITKKVNEYNNQNNKNIMFVDGENNHFNEPPNKI